MAIAEIRSRAQIGLTAPLVHVEVHLAAGLPCFNLVGLPAPVVRESRERVRAAIVNSGYDFPPGRITVNLAPVDLAKEGGRYDLPIALGLLRASGQARWDDAEHYECFGELGLSGELKPVAGVLLSAIHASEAEGLMVLPLGNLEEAARVAGKKAVGLRSLREVCNFLSEGVLPEDLPSAPCRGQPWSEIVSPEKQYGTLDDVLGHSGAKRALTVAAAGGHSLLLLGPPGSGKSLLASRLPGLLPALSASEALEVASLRSIASGSFDSEQWGRRPFRSPHHTASASAMLGGGPQLTPGEISLAHHGVLFMDEFPEFDRRVLESLREPLETGRVSLARAAGRLDLPAAFQLVAAMNPCPCGHHGDPGATCLCSPRAIERYRARLSGPLWDRIDLRVVMPRQNIAELLPGGRGRPGPRPDGESEPRHATVASQVAAARARQEKRAGCLNARLPVSRLESDCVLDEEAARLIGRVTEQLSVSGRGLHRMLRIARTVADLDESSAIGASHLAEAIQLRRALPETLA